MIILFLNVKVETYLCIYNNNFSFYVLMKIDGNKNLFPKIKYILHSSTFYVDVIKNILNVYLLSLLINARKKTH